MRYFLSNSYVFTALNIRYKASISSHNSHNFFNTSKITSKHWYQTYHYRHYYRIPNPRNILTLLNVLDHRGMRASPRRRVHCLFANPQNHLWTCTCIRSRPSPTFPAKLTASRIFFQPCSSLASLPPRVQASNECQRFARYDITRWRFQTIWDCVRREIFPSRGAYRGQFCDSCRRYRAPVFSALVVQLWLRVYE